MQKKITTATVHNPKNETIIPITQVIQIIELGTVTELTLGQDGWGTETPNRPVGLFKK
jgi:hypothetical protein